ncbi:hypothetical protein LCGC14_1428970 [marine sediment metagenome]|uniref:Uncharacterized protein n=2 Tax=root TaxID=1 RepID=A0A831QPX0_9FLAO|nr:hypothetical protein [Pricia antarctica]
MKYEILIEGGFTAIPREYEGAIEMQKETKRMLFNLFEKKLPPENQNLRDTLQYHLKLIDGNEEYNACFDETNLPLPIRQFIATVSKKK